MAAPAPRAAASSSASCLDAIMKKMRDLPSGANCFTGVKKEGIGHSNVVTSRLTQEGSFATRSLKSNAESNVSKATAHCDHCTAGVSASQMRVITPLVPQACKI